MPDMMRALCKTRPEKGAELVDSPIPDIGPDDVLVKVRATTICGTDLHIFNWDLWAQSRIKTPLVFGHECSGEVVEVGKNVREVRTGAYVSLPARVAWENPPDMAPEVASIQEPFGNAVYTVLSAPVTARTVLVTGCGPIGLWAVGIAKAAGAKAVYATDINPKRLALAEQMGATRAINSAENDPVEIIMAGTDGIGVDVLCEMSGNARAIKQGFQA